MASNLVSLGAAESFPRTCKMPFASITNLTSMRGGPAGVGGTFKKFLLIAKHLENPLLPQSPVFRFSPTSVQFKGEINGALPCKRHQKRHFEFCTAYLLKERVLQSLSTVAESRGGTILKAVHLIRGGNCFCR